MLREAIEALVVTVILATFVRTFLVQTSHIRTDSMEETLLEGDHVLVNVFIFSQPPRGRRVPAVVRDRLPLRRVERGDLVLFRHPDDAGKLFVKRCVGVAGDRIRLVGESLLVNGTRVDESGYRRGRDEDNGTAPHESMPTQPSRPITVPPGHLFLLGDNREASYDSRSWGPVPRRRVEGRPFLIYWSFDGEGLESPSDLAGRMRRLAATAARFWRSTRWNRTFQLVR